MFILLVWTLNRQPHISPTKRVYLETTKNCNLEHMVQWETMANTEKQGEETLS